ncbi:MAG: CPBP family intramembrane metalloprotease [Bacteroidota bacterium]|nr:CPBP family intramembrane metalloprotease [Bacteroidota bacterium]
MERSLFNDNYPLTQLGLTVVVALASLIISMLLTTILINPLFGSDAANLLNSRNLGDPRAINVLKFSQIILSVGMFVVPPLILGKIFSGSSFQYLKLNASPGSNRIALVLVLMLIAIPAINLLASLNSLIKLPPFMSAIEKELIHSEQNAELTTKAFLNIKTLPGLMVNLLMVGIIPALGEEFLFRGIFQRVFSNWTKNYHWGIIISAFIFSAFHMQFYGFFPRWLLGILFGYMLIWSGSLWLPIAAHFINNSMAVIAYYFVNQNVITEKAAEVGSNFDLLPLSIISCLLTAVGIYVLYLKRIRS